MLTFGNACWSFFTPASLTLVAVRLKFFELGKSLEVSQPGVADRGAAERQPSESSQSFEAWQSGVADHGAVEAQGIELSQSFEVFEAGIADPRPPEAQFLELRQPCEVLQAGVGYSSALTTQHSK